MRTLVVLPTYNESENVGHMIDALVAFDGLDVLVVDDASPDGTADVVNSKSALYGSRVRIFSRAGKLGLGSAYREGLAIARDSREHEAALIMDCDFSHDPADAPAVIARLSSADVAVGSRYTKGGAVSGWSLRRRVLSRFANRYARAVLGLPVHDCTSGFMAFTKDALKRFPFDRGRADGYAATVEIKWLAYRSGLRIAEAPIVFRDRTRGQSKLNGGIMFEAAWKLWALKAP